MKWAHQHPASLPLLIVDALINFSLPLPFSKPPIIQSVVKTHLSHLSRSVAPVQASRLSTVKLFCKEERFSSLWSFEAANDKPRNILWTIRAIFILVSATLLPLVRRHSHQRKPRSRKLRPSVFHGSAQTSLSRPYLSHEYLAGKRTFKLHPEWSLSRNSASSLSRSLSPSRNPYIYALRSTRVVDMPNGILCLNGIRRTEG